MLVDEIWDLITRNTHLVPSSRGWHHVNCRVCNDHGKKGKRGGFKKDDTSIGYNCFNCGASFVFDEQDPKISKEMKKILKCYDISSQEIDKIIFKIMRDRDGNSSTSKSQKNENIKISKVSSIPVKIPQSFIPIVKLPQSDPLYDLSLTHLQNKRLLNFTSYPFYICNSVHDKKWYGRLIIPVFNKGKMVYYQGYDLFDIRNSKYKSVPGVDSSSVLYGHERLFEDIDKPLFVAEGFFDAFHLSGVAIFGKKLTKEQIAILNRSPRRKVIVPDKTGDGIALATQALREKWEVATPDIGNEGDIMDAILRFGKPYVLESVHENIFSGALAECNLRIFCE